MEDIKNSLKVMVANKGELRCIELLEKLQKTSIVDLEGEAFCKAEFSDKVYKKSEEVFTKIFDDVVDGDGQSKDLYDINIVFTNNLEKKSTTESKETMFVYNKLSNLKLIKRACYRRADDSASLRNNPSERDLYDSYNFSAFVKSSEDSFIRVLMSFNNEYKLNKLHLSELSFITAKRNYVFSEHCCKLIEEFAAKENIEGYACSIGNPP